jgi:hypothetical protein
MRAAAIVFIALAALVAVLFGLLGLMSESGEVVVLRTTDSAGATADTRLWIVEHEEAQWLRGGNPDSTWLGRVRANPDVEMTRSDDTRAYRAVIVAEPAVRDRVNALMAEKYGTADRVIGWMSDRSAVVPIRLDPPQPR